MSEFKTPLNDQEFEQNFAQIKPNMNRNEAFYESSRCLNCYDAPCVTACPTGIDIPLFIKQINSNNPIGAAKTIYDSNYLANTCGKVCPTEVLCEGACAYNHQNIKPIEIGRLQSYASNIAISQDKNLFKLGASNGKKVAVIGAGPAGVSCASELRILGFEVDIFEAKNKPSGLSVHGVAPYKLTNKEALEEVDYLQSQLGFQIKLNHPIANEEDVKMLETNYQAIFLGIGLGKTADIGLNGEHLENCEGAVEFVSRLRKEKAKVKVQKNVIVLGGGNTAMDAASECARMGAESVILAYRNSKENMGAYYFEYDLAKEAGVKGMFHVSPKEIIGTEKVEGVRFIRTYEVNGKLEEIAGSEFVIECDAVIKATGQSKQKDLILKLGLEMDSKGRIIVNNATQQCSKAMYFAAGDAVSGGQEVVNASADGKTAAKAIHKFLIG